MDNIKTTDMGYWQTPEEAGLTQEEKNEIVEGLWKKAIENSNRHCPDCSAEPGEYHMVGCDVARCHCCGGQAISCDCENPGRDTWEGVWPGDKQCYELKLITRGDFGKGSWIFDLNELARRS
jgi:hypothetical protein